MPALDELAERALDARSLSNRPRQQLFEYAVCNDEPAWLARLDGVRFEPARAMLTLMDDREATIARIGANLVKRYRAPYQSGNPKEVMRQVDQYGPDFRTPFGHTPLMLAAFAGNARLVEALLARGADVELIDNTGASPSTTPCCGP